MRIKKPSTEDLRHAGEATAEWVKGEVPKTFREWLKFDARWSYIVIGLLVIAGALANWLFASSHGWTAWPFVLAAGIIVMIHEAAERNGQGVPPLHVYAFFFGSVFLWIVVMTILSVTNPLILIAAVAGLGFYCARAYLKQCEKMKLIEKRRADGCCVHCGSVIEDAQLCFCPECGEEPDPQMVQLQRVASIVAGNANAARARAILKQESASAAASKKERAFVNSRPRKSTGRMKK